MGRAEAAERVIEAAASIRLAADAVDDPHARRELERAERLLLRDVDAVPKQRAAALLGISVTALQRWIASGDLPAVRRPRGREEVDARALLDLVAEVRRQTDERSQAAPVARALRRLAARGLQRRKLRPNQPAHELRAAYVRSTPTDRLREAAELSYAATALARYGARRARASDGR